MNEEQILIRDNVIHTYNKFFVDMQEELAPIIKKWRKEVGQDIYIEYRNPLVRALKNEVYQEYEEVLEQAAEDKIELKEALNKCKAKLRRNGILERDGH